MDKRIEDNVYSLEVRMQKLEEALAYDRKIISDLQAVSMILSMREREREQYQTFFG